MSYDKHELCYKISVSYAIDRGNVHEKYFGPSFNVMRKQEHVNGGSVTLFRIWRAEMKPKPGVRQKKEDALHV